MTHAAIPHRLSHKTRSERYRPAAHDFAPIGVLLRWERERAAVEAYDDGMAWHARGLPREVGERRVFKVLREAWHAGFDAAEKAAREHAARVATGE